MFCFKLHSSFVKSKFLSTLTVVLKRLMQPLSITLNNIGMTYNY